MLLLKAFKYKTPTWELNLTDLQGQNLLVGRNSVGKSKAVQAIARSAGIIMQTFDIRNLIIQVEMNLLEGDHELLYSFSFDHGKVLAESMILKIGPEKKVYITRDNNVATLDGETVNVPEGKLTVHVRRDTVLYPFIEGLFTWAQGVKGLSFNEIDGDLDNGTNAWFAGNGISLYEMVDAVKNNSQPIIQRMQKAGYPIKSLGVFAPKDYPDIKIVVVAEDKVVVPLFSSSLSKGMLRTLYIFLLLEYMLQKEKPSILLVDDFCEGLDYSRSVSVGKMVFDLCNDMGIQLVAVSNDSYLMDVVSLDYWHILEREGGRVTAISRYNNPGLFEDFEFTGLNNFHLFSSDFINNYSKKIH